MCTLNADTDTDFSSLGNQEKGVLAKGVSAEPSVTSRKQKIPGGNWAQQYIWHSERHRQERRICLRKNPPSKNPLCLVPDSLEINPVLISPNLFLEFDFGGISPLFHHEVADKLSISGISPSLGGLGIVMFLCPMPLLKKIRDMKFSMLLPLHFP